MSPSPSFATLDTNQAEKAPLAGGLAGIKNKLPFLRTRKGIALTVLAVVLVLGGGLSGLAALHTRRSGSGSKDTSNQSGPSQITSDTYFYGDSPPVYPSPNATGVGLWAISYNKAVAFVQNTTLEERVALVTGVAAPNGCNGYIPPIKRLGFPGMCLGDAGNGVRNTDFVSAWPAGIHVGASWNRDLALARGAAMAGEFRKKGVNVMLGPVVGPVGRTVRGGRNWEGFSVDPYLAGALAAETVTGAQDAGVIASTKHFIGNEQETNRQPSGDVEAVSANIDDRTMHETYLWPFQDAVRAGSGTIMCSYNRVNNSYGCANSKTLNGLLKTELGFQGFVVSDWGAQHAGVATALAGMDMAMPDSSFWGAHLVQAVNNGSVAESRVTDMAVRILTAWYHMGQDAADFPAPGVGMPKDLTKPHTIVDARNSSDRDTLLQGAIEGHVLLKNTNNTLPLKKPQILSLFGYSAKAPDQNNYASGSGGPWTYGAQSAEAADTLGVFNGEGVSQLPLGIAPNGTLFTGGGSGAASLSLVSAPFDAITQQAWADGTALFWDFLSVEPDVEAASEACLVFGNAWASEGYDRAALQDAYTDGLVQHVADRCRNTIVVLHNAGVRVVDAWIDHPNVTALVFAHLPGQASGEALVALLYGRANPSGKLPYTVPRQASDIPGGLADPAEAGDSSSRFARFPQANFSEGVFLDYRAFDAATGVTPRFAFGYGLSYTTFAFANLTVAVGGGGGRNNDSSSSLFAPYPTGAVRPGGAEDLWDELVTVTAAVTNTGAVAGAEVAQLYVTVPGAGSNSNGSSSTNTNNSTNSSPNSTPVRQLRGFAKCQLNATATATVSFGLTRRDLSIWDVAAQQWLLQAGTYGVRVGASSDDAALEGTFTI